MSYTILVLCSIKFYVLYYSRLMENKLFLRASVNRERPEVTLNRSKVC